MASASFRDSMASLGWTRRDSGHAANTSSSTPILSRLQSLNPFGNGGYVRLPTHESPGAPLPAPSRREEEEGWFACKLSQTASGAAVSRARRASRLSPAHCRIVGGL